MIYEFVCDSCGRRADVFRKVANAGVPEVCECGATMRKLISSPNFKMKKPKVDAGKAVRHFQKLKRGERIYESPWSRERIRLPDNKKDAEDAAFRVEQKTRPNLKRKDFELTNF